MSAGTNTNARRPLRAAAAATAPARLPVDAHAIVSRPSSSARASATDTGRSLNDSVGLRVSSFRYKRSMPSATEALGFDKRRPAHRPMRRRSCDRQQWRVAPERRRSALDVGAQRLRLEYIQVVLRLDRPEALPTHVALVGRLQGAARATAKPAQRGDLLERRRHVRSPLKIKKASRAGGLET